MSTQRHIFIGTLELLLALNAKTAENQYQLYPGYDYSADGNACRKHLKYIFYGTLKIS